jgi:hypothetical protein
MQLRKIVRKRNGSNDSYYGMCGKKFYYVIIITSNLSNLL